MICRDTFRTSHDLVIPKLYPLFLLRRFGIFPFLQFRPSFNIVLEDRRSKRIVPSPTLQCFPLFICIKFGADSSCWQAFPSRFKSFVTVRWSIGHDRDMIESHVRFLSRRVDCTHALTTGHQVESDNNRLSSFLPEFRGALCSYLVRI